ncbi:hypothetical protein GCM10023193_27140 [Planotetraspora kaengkrachanensis]|uniref:Uncharacterized protein n=1 Tax=Planotetraspora kaengkrachanensis TaxID=575193 RepID=A0A8J3PQM2_9ACTN|nr:hypothetical protein Pka01_13840 [Planotetraspora kaengkrachanensis]
MFGGLELMLPEAGEALVLQARNQQFRSPIRPTGLTCLTCWNMLHMGDTPLACGNGEQAVEKTA